MHRIISWSRAIALSITLAAGASVASAEQLVGTPGASARWGSGWIDLDQGIDLKKGDHLRLKVGGTANKVLVRFLDDLNRADDPVGVEGGIRDVPKDRVVEVTLAEDHPRVKQISVHGGSRAWNWSFPGDNGPAALEAVERVKP